MEIVLIIGGILVLIYLIFVRRTSQLYKAIKIVTNKVKDTVVINQTFEQITNTINAQFKQVVNTSRTVLFIYKDIEYLVIPINEKQVLLSIKPNKNENNFFDEKPKLLADYIISRGWTKKEENAIVFTRTLIHNMGYEKSYDYIKNTSNEFYDTYMDIYSTIHSKEEDILDCDSLNIIICNLLNQGLHDILINLSKKENDIINITFSWENYKDSLKKEIDKLNFTYEKKLLDIILERLMKYMCHIITYRNTTL